MNAIPTRYAGVQFRSRLEARWAAMFDLLEWQWEYEPIDLNGYIPDFYVQLGRPMLIEVKPIMWIDVNLPSRRDDACWNEMLIAQDKITRSGWNGDSLIVGARLFSVCDGTAWWTCPGVRGRSPGSAENQECIFTRCWVCRGATIMSIPTTLTGAARNLGAICPTLGCAHQWKTKPSNITRINPQLLWREAGNRVQWRAPGPRGATR